MRRWENQEVAGRGTKFCLVIDPEDGTQPIRTYGWSTEEVLDKVAKTAEAAQQLINRQRSAQATPPVRTTPEPPRAAVTPEEQMTATADLQNPAKAPAAIKTLLRAEGIDVDGLKLREEAKIAAAVAREWERNHPDFPHDDRNQRMLMDKALLIAGGRLGNITADILDHAYTELLRFGMLFEVSEEVIDTPPSAPNGNSATRVERPRIATSYRRNSLSNSTPPVVERKPKYTRAEIDNMNRSVYREKYDNEPGFKELVNSYLSTPA